MQKTIIVKVSVECSEASTFQKEEHLNDIVERIRWAAEKEKTDPDNRIINVEWDEPRAADVEVTIDEIDEAEQNRRDEETLASRIEMEEKAARD